MKKLTTILMLALAFALVATTAGAAGDGYARPDRTAERPAWGEGGAGGQGLRLPQMSVSQHGQMQSNSCHPSVPRIPP